MSRRSRSLNLLKPQQPHQACSGKPLPLLYCQLSSHYKRPQNDRTWSHRSDTTDKTGHSTGRLSPTPMPQLLMCRWKCFLGNTMKTVRLITATQKLTACDEDKGNFNWVRLRTQHRLEITGFYLSEDTQQFTSHALVTSDLSKVTTACPTIFNTKKFCILRTYLVSTIITIKNDYTIQQVLLPTLGFRLQFLFCFVVNPRLSHRLHFFGNQLKWRIFILFRWQP